MERCEWFVLVLSPQAVESRWVKLEFLFALDEPRYRDHILPVIYRPCDARPLSWTLRSFQMIDFTGSFRAPCRELLRTWGIGYRP